MVIMRNTQATNAKAETMTTKQIGTVWTSRARIQIIDDCCDPPRWVTVESCVDTPHAIGNAFAKARQNHPDDTLWVNSDTAGRTIC